MKNPQAFPDPRMINTSKHSGKFYDNGMTLRDYAQIRFMQSLISTNFIKNEDGFNDVRYDYDEICVEAERYADAMLKERNG